MVGVGAHRALVCLDCFETTMKEFRGIIDSAMSEASRPTEER
jgi:hypothetical protein